MPQAGGMKILGAVMALAASGMIGFMRIAAGRSRKDTLEAFTGALVLMKGELSARLTPLPELTEYLAMNSCAGAGRFFRVLSERIVQLGRRELAELWTETARDTLTMLSADELDEIMRLGRVLGRCELDMQLAAIDRCTAHLDRALTHVRAEYPQLCRLSIGLPAAAGLMLVIVLF